MTTRLRAPIGGTALVAGLLFLSGATAAPTLPAEAVKKTAEADIAQLQKHIQVCIDDPKEAKKFAPTARAMAMMLAMYAESSGDEALRKNALKTFDDLGKKDFKAALDGAKGLTLKPGGKALAPAGLEKNDKFALDDVMSPFRRGEKYGGMNIEKDIRDMRDGKLAADPDAVRILATRVTVIGEYTVGRPNDKASVNDANKKKWEKWSKDMVDLSKKIGDEAGKGKKADEKEIVKMMKALDAKCTECHNEFRD